MRASHKAMLEIKAKWVRDDAEIEVEREQERLAGLMGLTPETPDVQAAQP